MTLGGWSRWLLLHYRPHDYNQFESNFLNFVTSHKLGQNLLVHVARKLAHVVSTPLTHTNSDRSLLVPTDAAGDWWRQILRSRNQQALFSPQVECRTAWVGETRWDYLLHPSGHSLSVCGPCPPAWILLSLDLLIQLTLFIWKLLSAPASDSYRADSSSVDITNHKVHYGYFNAHIFLFIFHSVLNMTVNMGHWQKTWSSISNLHFFVSSFPV